MYLRLQVLLGTNLLHMQKDSPPGDVAALFDRLIEESLPGRRGEPAWRALLQAHATLMRQLDTDLRGNTGLRLADFDVLAQLAAADGELRMTELAARTLISRSGLTRRVARLVDEGLLRRANATDDGRGVIVALTDAGLARVNETVPVHLRGVSKLFVERLDDHELAVLQTALSKVIVDCTFG
jgi:DNA-binding MarR family transcriptional regulator